MPEIRALDDQLCFSLYATSMAMSRAYKPMLDQLGITYPQYLVLHTLWEQDGRTIGAIAERLSLESSTITPPVKRLETSGFVERKRNPADERQVQVWLTAKGAEMREQCACIGENIFETTDITLEQLLKLNREVRRFWDMLRVVGPGTTVAPEER